MSAANRLDGALVFARLAERFDCRRQHSSLTDGRGVGAVDYEADHQHHDARRVGAGHRYPRRYVHSRD